MLAAWVDSALACYDGELADLGGDLRAAFLELCDLRASRRVFALGFQQPPWQAIVVVPTRNPRNRAPFVRENLMPWQAVAAIDEVLLDSVWDEPEPPESEGTRSPASDLDGTMRPAGESVFLRIASLARTYPAMAPMRNSMIVNGGGFRIFVIHNTGPLDEADSSLPTKQALGYARQNLENRANAGPPPKTRFTLEVFNQPIHPAHGAYIVPRLRVGRIRNRTVRNLQAAENAHPGVTTFKGQLGGREILATHTGFVCIRTTKPKEAQEELNLVMGGLLRAGYPASVVRGQDLAGVHPIEEEDFLGWGGTYSAMPMQDPSGPGASPWSAHMTADAFRAVVRDADSLRHKPWIGYLGDFLEALTHHRSAEYPQTILFAWAIIERWSLSECCRLDSARKDRWNNARLADRLKTLHKLGILDVEQFRKFSKGREVRNRVLHGELPAAEKWEADEALDLVEEHVLREALRGAAPPSRRVAVL